MLVSVVPAWAAPPANGPPAAVLPTCLRRPVALAISADGRWLSVANRRSGTISTVDTETRNVVGEAAVGRVLADLVGLPDGRLLAVDEAEAQLVLLASGGPALRVADRLAVAATPVSVCVSSDGKRAAVASLWPRRVTLVEVPGSARAQGGDANDVASLHTARVVAVPFAPRKLQFAGSGDKLVVADAFDGGLALVDMTNGELVSTWKLPAHNIRGLASGHDGRNAVLLLAHQVLNPLARTD
ncbi:MAG TPA: hypothetical protein VGX76_07375, partial [Pirellulales bacterium]|nr:hypothetical protein [Pirellulales bacterium]